MKKRPILNAYETKIFNEWIADGNAVEQTKGVWVEQSTQYRKKFTYEELQKFFKKEYLSYNGGGSAKEISSKTKNKKEKSFQLKAYNVGKIEYKINPTDEGLENIFKNIISKETHQARLQGVNFDNNGATGTDAFKLVHIVGKKTGSFENGTYYPFTEIAKTYESQSKEYKKAFSLTEHFNRMGIIEQTYPNWMAVVPKSYDYAIPFNLLTLYDILKSFVVSKMLNESTNAVILEFTTKDGLYQIGFNAKILMHTIESLMRTGIENVTGYFTAPSRAVIFVDSNIKVKQNEKDTFFEKNTFGLVMPIMIGSEEDLQSIRTQMILDDGKIIVIEFPIIRYISPNEYEIQIEGMDTMIYSRGKSIQIKSKKTQPKATPQSTTKTTDKKTALGNKLRKGMVVRIEYKESNGSTLSNDLFFDDGKFIKYILITDKKGKELSETEETLSESELNEYYKEYKEYIIDEFYENMADGGQLGKQMTLFNTGGKIGFDALAKKVAKRYAGEKVQPQYQAEYGKKYSKSEAEEVGKKVAGKVYWQQQGRKLNGGGGVGETMREKIAKMNISLNTQTGQVFVGGLKPKNKLYSDEKGYYLIEGYSKFLNKKYPIKKYFNTDENLVLNAYMQNNYGGGGKVLASSSSKEGINKIIEQYLYGSTITLVETDNDKIYEVHNKKGKTSFYVEFSRGKYKFIQPSKFVGGGKAIRQTQFAVYKLLDKEGLVKYFTDTDLEKFLEEWNEDYNTDYEDFVEFNEYEREFTIKPVFSKNDMGGMASQPSFLEIQINDVPNWENYELANYLDAPISLVEKNRNFYVKEVQNEMMLNVIPNYAGGGSLDKKYNFSDFGIKSYRELIDAGKFSSKFKSISNASDFDRIKFNRMRGSEQVEYVRKLNKQKIEYNLRLNNDDRTFYTVKKEIFDYADIPETEEQNFYTKFDEPTGFIYSVGGSAKKSMENSPLKEYYEKYTNGGFVGGDIIKFKYDGKDFTRKVESVDEMGNAVVNIMKTQKATINPADVFEIKKEKDDKSIIIEKIGLNEENANFLIGLSPTFAVWLADSIVELVTNSNLYGTRSETIELINKKPVLLTALRERIIGILDWLQHPTTRKQNLRKLTFAEAERKSEEWHDELQTAGGDIDFVEPIENTVITEYPENDNGVKYYWVFIPKGYCDVESARMGHCGRTGAGSLISLRSIRPYTEGTTITDSHVTIAYNKEEGLFYQSKGKRNAKPSEKYFPYIFDLIKMMASGQVTEKFKLSQQEKIKELEGQKIELEKEVNKLQKYFESREAIEEDTNVLVDKAIIFQNEKNKLQNINSQIEKLNEESSFDFNGFGSEYQSSNDYGYEDMTNEQVKELYEIKPDIFDDFAGQFMLYEAGLIDEKPNTSFLLEKYVDFVVDLLRVDRNTRDGIVKEVLSGETYDLIDAGYYYDDAFENAGDYVEQLKGVDYESVLDKIVEITGYDKEEVKENGAEYYLNGEDENFDSDSFDDIKRAIGNALAVATEADYAGYFRNQIVSALEELGTIEKLDDTGVVLNIDLSNLLSMSQISAISRALESNSVEDIFFEAESQGEFELPLLKIDDRYEPYPENWQEYFDINNYKEGGVIYQDLSKIKPMVVNDNTVLTEFEVKKSKSGIEINDKIMNSDDVVNILRKIWEEDTMNAYEQAYVLFMNKNNKVIGYYHHSNGGIDGTIMDVQMISGMAVKSLAKGVIIAHNHPSGNATPSPADNQVTKQLSEALKLFNIQLLDSIILTEKSYLSFANEGLI